MREIYQQTVEEVLDHVESRESGLASEQVKRSREKCGWNELAEGKKKVFYRFSLSSIRIFWC
jgi:Cation transporter/ATPase, N-terminus.